MTTAGAWRRAGPSFVCALAAAVVLSACGPRVPPLADARSSPDVLAAAVLDGLGRRDPAALRRLAVSEQEFRDHVWPGLPASRPERNLPFSYVWGDLRQKSDASLARTLAARGGRRFELVEVRFAGGTTDYPGYRVHRDAELVVTEDGAHESIRIFGSMLEKDGVFKIFSYVVDD